MNKLLYSIITTSLYISLYNSCMTPSLTEIQPQQYRELCIQILEKDNTIFKKFKYSLETYHPTPEQLVQKKASYLDALKKQKTILFTRVDNLLDRIKDTYNISDNSWDTFRTIAHEKHIYRVYMQKLPLLNSCHDQTIPQGIRDFICTNLQMNSIHPKQINIYNKPNSCFPYISYNTQTQTDPITLYIDVEQFSKLHQSHQLTLICFVIESIFQNAQLLPSTLVKLESLFNTTNESIIFNKDYQELEGLCKNTLNICLPCINNPNLAYHMLHFYHDCYHADFTLKDYEQLSKINRYKNCITLIDNYLKHLNLPSETEQVIRSHSK